MHRRKFFSLVALATSGCLGSDSTDSDDSGADSTYDRQSADPEQSEVATEIIESELTTRTLTNAEVFEVVGELENTGNTYIHTLVLQTKFLGTDGNLLETAPDSINHLAPGEIWRFNMRYPKIASKERKIGDFNIVEDTLVGGSEPVSDPASVLELVSEDNHRENRGANLERWFVSGEFRNVSGSDIRSAQVAVKFKDAEGRLLATGLDSISNLSAGQTWEFETEIPERGYWARQAATYEILLIRAR